ncbi:MAG: excinuclease ABC subunit UvrA [Chloroflexota bacterium]|nr:excinuclease ABC subunit UvrA [Chloroflexota bacterium]
MSDKIVVRGARAHNLKNIDVELPRDKLVVITGLSGSGKSSLAFDTIYAEGQRRYVESLSAYARQFLGQMDKPDVDTIEGLSPAISIDQKGASRNPRSTVGTITEIYDYLRLLFARVGHPHCPNCGREIQPQSATQIVDTVQALPAGSRIMVLAPIIKDRKGEHTKVFEDIRKAGYVRARVDGTVYDLDAVPELDRYKMHTVEVVVDRLVIKAAAPQAALAAVGAGPAVPGSTFHVESADPDRSRLADSIESALKLGEGTVRVAVQGGEEAMYSEHAACAVCGISLGAIEPRTFSFNSPHGACPTCTGLGTMLDPDPDLVVSDAELSLADGALGVWSRSILAGEGYYLELLEALADANGFTMTTPWKDLTAKQRELIVQGTGNKTVHVKHKTSAGQTRIYDTTFEGVIPWIKRRHRESTSDGVRGELENYMSNRPCPTCGGKRLKPESLGVTVGDRNIVDVTQLSVRKALDWAMLLADDPAAPGRNGHPILSERETIIAVQILKEIRARLGFLKDVGLEYLTIDRTAATLAGGEAQRIRLATQIGSSLMGVIYILDEPSIGLHQRDNARLIKTLLRLRDLGNTLLVVEHDEETMRVADWIVDIGPGAGEHGGRIVAQGTPAQVAADPHSATGRYLAGIDKIAVPAKRRAGNGAFLEVRDATANNLKHLTVRFPLGMFVCVTGVSGSGKSTLVTDILYRELARKLNRAKERAGQHGQVLGIEHLDKVIEIDQSPIGRTPRSNPATYTGMFTAIRETFAKVPEAKLRGYTSARFSFNVKGGRCEACRGEGIIEIEMQFLPAVYVPCEVCHGQRYNREALEIRYKGKTIADVLNMTVEEALGFFENIPAIRNKLATLNDVGLGYIHLGQPATTLSGGEAQRVKLATELSRRATGKTIYILDEPTTGLHFGDVQRLLEVLQRLTDAGNSILVIEHNLDVIKTADWLIDLGPEGGDGGGGIVAEGTPEAVARVAASHTGQFLARMLG